MKFNQTANQAGYKEFDLVIADKVVARLDYTPNAISRRDSWTIFYGDLSANGSSKFDAVENMAMLSRDFCSVIWSRYEVASREI